MELQVTRPVGEIAVEMPASIALFEAKGIDYCCGGKMTLGEACRKAGVDGSEVLQALQRMEGGQVRKEREKWFTLGSLIQHILDKHHAYTREQVALVHRLGSKVLMVHGSRHPELQEVLTVFGEMAEELLDHMMKEEQVAFPYLRGLESPEGRLAFSFGAFQGGPERVLRMDHETTGGQLGRLRDLTDRYTPPQDACVTFRAFYQGMKELERDIHEHVFLENEVLFPMAERSAKSRERSDGLG